MKRFIFLVQILLWTCVQSPGQLTGPRLSNGIISLVENGQQRTIQIGRRCADLWVAPDGSAIAFIAIENSRPPSTSAEHGDFIEQSSVYIARRVNGFSPERLEVIPFMLHGRAWNIARSPSLSPDLKTVYFLVPEFATSGTLMMAKLPRDIPSVVRDAVGYAVIWGGDHAGDILMQVRDHSEAGVLYPCHLRTNQGTETVVADDAHCWTESFFQAWTREHGGSVSLPRRTD